MFLVVKAQSDKHLKWQNQLILLESPQSADSLTSSK